MKISSKLVSVWSAATSQNSKLELPNLRKKEPKYCSAADAVKLINSREHIYVHHACSTPTDLLKALAERVINEKLTGIQLSHALLFGHIPWTEPQYFDKMRSTCIFICPNLRKLVNEGNADYLPVFLNESSKIYDQKALRVDTALLNLSPPDEHGYCSLGINVDMSSAAARNANKIIAIINKSQPRTFGDTQIHISQVDAIVEADTPIYVVDQAPATAQEQAIGKLIAEHLVCDGATIQLGIGSTADAVVKNLKNHKDLGVHTELLSTSVQELIECNVVTNNNKTLYPGKVVTAFAMGSRKFYDFLDNNPLILFGSAGYTNAVNVVASNRQMTAINSGIEVDLTGQVVSDSIGKTFYSGFGGQVDFIYGASIGYDGLGKSIIALPSRTSKGESKIVPYIKQGSGVVTTRAHVNYVVTEHGIAQLWGKSVRQRAYELIQIAHPDDRHGLEKAAFEKFKFLSSSAAEDEIRDLPGLTFDINFKHYSGYLQVSPVHFLHYWFVESQSSPETDPLMFWFNGGPGRTSFRTCPYFVNEDGTSLRRNPDSWNKFANVVFLESPAGVGQSYYTDENDTTNDEQTAKENYEAIKQFFSKFPKFRDNSFYITGESYAGIYIPTLANQIIEGQQKYAINLKGIAIGNGIMDSELNDQTLMEFAYYHGFLDEKLWNQFLKECCHGIADNCNYRNLSAKCYKIKRALEFDGINGYDVYRPCESNQKGQKRTGNSFSQRFSAITGPTDPQNVKCFNDTAVFTYLNNKEVKQALHISPKAFEWTVCSGNLQYYKQYENMYKEIKEVIEANVAVLLYFGDTDTACNFLMGQKFSERLGYQLKEQKKPWTFDGQVAGFLTQYDKKLTYMTILGAGHMAPEWRAPEMNYAMKQFVTSQPI
uniref:Acetyl-CoA hydrolase n=1 Tax=Ditylenchus dipsaci TaxID=166011 RepID=A0A915CZ76_9BILA